jgi:hypothetical protein
MYLCRLLPSHALASPALPAADEALVVAASGATARIKLPLAAGAL